MAGVEVGVGVLLNPSLDSGLETLIGAVDFAPFVPDRLWRTIDGADAYRRLTAAWEMVRRAKARVPVPLHAIGLSIGSAEPIDDRYLAEVLGLVAELESPWWSDHLSTVRVGDHEAETPGVVLPIVYDRITLDELIERVASIVERSPRPFLLENPASFFVYPEQDFDEPEFLNRLCDGAGCGILLDLHNLVCNVRNLGTDPKDYLSRLDLDRVIEVHVAGGLEMYGFWSDAHFGYPDSAALDLLPAVVRGARHLRCVTFEFHEASFETMGLPGVVAQAQALRRIVEDSLSRRVA